MKILHLMNHSRNLGNGIVNVAIDLACTQASLGHSVAVASAGGDFEELLCEKRVLHFTIDQQHRSPVRLLIAFYRLSSVIRRLNPDVIHAHMMTGAVLAWALKPWLRVIGYSFKLITTVHNAFQKSAFLMVLGDQVIAVSDAVLQIMCARGIPKSKLHIVYNGPLNTPRFKGAPICVALEQPAIVTVAGLYVRKGISDLLSAFYLVKRECPGVQLYIVGDGPDRVLFERQANELQLGQSIHFVGHLSDPRSYMDAATLFVLASHFEAFGLVLSEARASGCAIIATRVEGIPEALDGGIAGLLVPPRDPLALAAAIISLLKDDKLRQQLQSNAVANLERFSVERAAVETIEVYNLALKR